MKIVVIFLAIIALAIASDLKKKPPLVPVRYADPILLQKQKFVLEILNHIHEPLKNPEYLPYASSWVSGKANYKDYEPIYEFIHYYQNGMLPKNEIFSVFNKDHLKQAITAFNLLYLSNDWDTFYKNAIFLRQNINEGMFVYVLTVAAIHKPDMAGIVLPAPYEVSPYLFFDGQAINDAQNWKTKATLYKGGVYVISSNYSSDYYLMNEEAKMAYFTEDIGWNSYYYYYHIDYPFWLNGSIYNLKQDRRGELFLYMHQQILARYNLERLSNRLGEVQELVWTDTIKSGYNPHMRYYNGLPFSARKNNFDVSSMEDYTEMNLIDDYERRIRDAIDYGYYTTRNGEKIDLRQPEAVEIIGNIIEANPDSVDTRFFGYWNLLSHLLLGGAHWDSTGSYKPIPSVLEHYETALRDPVFYQLYNRMLKQYSRFQHFLPPYTATNLTAAGIQIDKVTVGKLVTYFDYFYADITNAVDSSLLPKVPGTASTPMGMISPLLVSSKASPEFVLVAQQARLNHKPFGLAVEVTSTAPQKVVVRTYLGPKYDQYGNAYELNEIRKNLVEIDQFLYDLPLGKATIVRLSRDFFWSVKDRTTYHELYKQVLLAVGGTVPFPIDMSEAHCGFPDRLLLPKGSVSGLPLQLIVVLTPYQAPAVPQYSTYDHTISCGIGSGSRYIDDLPFGYPFDREIIDETEFLVPNVFMKDVLVYHKIEAAVHVPLYN